MRILSWATDLYSLELPLRSVVYLSMTAAQRKARSRQRLRWPLRTSCLVVPGGDGDVALSRFVGGVPVAADGQETGGNVEQSLHEPWKGLDGQKGLAR